jgi:organic hydroperoxide reductase OsmC/OhrA
MSEYMATISWTRGGAKFTDNRYSRAHRWEFDGGAVVKGAASAHVVPKAFTDETAVDPEEAFIASLSSCHMLWFLSIAARAGHVVESYRDEAVGVMRKNAEGRMAMTEATLRPHVVFAPGSTITPQEWEKLHDEAHHECFIANSVTTTVATRGTFTIAEP